MSSKELARDLAVLKALSERVKAARDTTASVALSEMDVTDRTAAKLPDGTVIGTVSVAAGRVTSKVVDLPALLEHVKATAPSEVVTVEEIRPAYLAKVLAEVKETGEIIPGVDLVEGDPYTVVRLASGAADAVTRAWADGSLPLPAVMRPSLPEAQS